MPVCLNASRNTRHWWCCNNCEWSVSLIETSSWCDGGLVSSARHNWWFVDVLDWVDGGGSSKSWMAFLLVWRMNVILTLWGWMESIEWTSVSRSNVIEWKWSEKGQIIVMILVLRAGHCWPILISWHGLMCFGSIPCVVDRRVRDHVPWWEPNSEGKWRQCLHPGTVTNWWNAELHDALGQCRHWSSAATSSRIKHTDCHYVGYLQISTNK